MASRAKKGGPNGAPELHLTVNNGPAGARESADEEEIEELDVIEDGALSRAIREVRNVEGAKAEVHRIGPPDHPRLGLVYTYPVSMFTMEQVQRTYGAGKYRVRFKGPGDKYIKGGSTFDIAEGLGGGGPAAAQPAPVASGVQELLAVIREDREREKEARDAKRGEWIEWAKLLVPLLAPKILELLAGNKAPSQLELIRALKEMKELAGEPTGLTQQLDQVFKLINGAKELVGANEPQVGSTWVDLLREALGAAKPMIGKLAAALPIPGAVPTMPPRLPARLPLDAAASASTNSAPVAPRSAPSVDTAPSTAPESLPAEGDEVFAQLGWLKATVEQLLMQAQKNANPRLYGEVTLDNLPPFLTADKLLEYLSPPDWFGKLQQLDARVSPYEEWFTRFRDYVLKVVTARKRKAEAERAPPPPDGAPGLNQPSGDESDE